MLFRLVMWPMDLLLGLRIIFYVHLNYLCHFVFVQSPPCERVTDSNIPSDAIGVGSYYSQVDLPPCNSWIEVYVSNIASPGQFWFQLRGTKTSLALEKLMNHLEYVMNNFLCSCHCQHEKIKIILCISTMIGKNFNYQPSKSLSSVGKLTWGLLGNIS